MRLSYSSLGIGLVTLPMRQKGLSLAVCAARGWPSTLSLSTPFFPSSRMISTSSLIGSRMLSRTVFTRLGSVSLLRSMPTMLPSSVTPTRTVPPSVLAKAHNVASILSMEERDCLNSSPSLSSVSISSLSSSRFIFLTVILSPSLINVWQHEDTGGGKATPGQAPCQKSRGKYNVLLWRNRWTQGLPLPADSLVALVALLAAGLAYWKRRGALRCG